MSRQVCKEIIDHGAAMSAALAAATESRSLWYALDTFSREAAGAVSQIWAPDGVPPTAAPPSSPTFAAAVVTAQTMLRCLVDGITFHGPADTGADFELVHKAMLGVASALAPTLDVLAGASEP